MMLMADADVGAGIAAAASDEMMMMMMMMMKNDIGPNHHPNCCLDSSRPKSSIGHLPMRHL